MNDFQRRAFASLLALELPVSEFHHGSCQGADVEAARLVRKILNCRIIRHPGPDGDPHREDSGVDDEILPPLNHFARNRKLVEACDVLVGFPLTKPLGGRGGTAYTINFSIKRGKRTIIVWPDGTVEDHPAKGGPT